LQGNLNEIYFYASHCTSNYMGNYHRLVFVIKRYLVGDNLRKILSSKYSETKARGIEQTLSFGLAIIIFVVTLFVILPMFISNKSQPPDPGQYSLNRSQPPEPARNSSNTNQTLGSWRESEITATPISQIGVNLDSPDRVILSYEYTIQNNTGVDYYLPNDSKNLFVVHPDEKGLTNDNKIEWDKGLYLPPGKKVQTAFKIAYAFDNSATSASRQERLTQLIKQQVKELGGFVILDANKRYKIIFPKP
jgi:hypothetical protein